MATRNPITGDLIKTKVNSQEYKENLEKLFGDKPPQRGRWKQDPETGKMIPLSEWHQRQSEGLTVFVDSFEPYESPVTGKVISTRQERINDLHASGCRPYEGFQSENREAMKHRKEQEDRLVKKMYETAERTFYEMEHGYR